MKSIALALVLALSCLLFARDAFAGSYLDRAAVLMDGARKEGDMLGTRTKDTDFVAALKLVAEARSKAAKKMTVPASVAKAHPHLLLCLESYDKAFLLAEQGSVKKALEHLSTAREEERIFRALLSQLGYTLPKV